MQKSRANPILSKGKTFGNDSRGTYLIKTNQLTFVLSIKVIDDRPQYPSIDRRFYHGKRATSSM